MGGRLRISVAVWDGAEKRMVMHRTNTKHNKGNKQNNNQPLVAEFEPVGLKETQLKFS